jgi:parallel beta-helix repeat protein
MRTCSSNITSSVKLFVVLILLSISISPVNLQADDEFLFSCETMGVGTYFEITDSLYPQVSLTSEESVSVYLTSLPGNLNYTIKNESSSQSTILSITGLEPGTVYYHYQDGSFVGEIIADGLGECFYNQDLSQVHSVTILEERSTIYIKSDGTIEPTDSPITNDGDMLYTLTEDIEETIVIQRSGITFDGDGHALISLVPDPTRFKPTVGVKVHYLTDVTIKNLVVQGFFYGIEVHNSSSITIEDCTIEEMSWTYANAIDMRYSSNNLVTGNTITLIGDVSRGVALYRADANLITNNFASNCTVGIVVGTENDYNLVIGNVLTDNTYGVMLGVRSDYNQVYYNNFFSNHTHARRSPGSPPSVGNVFDDGSRGNYWDTWTEPDVDGDGIVDLPYSFFSGADFFPLTEPCSWSNEPPFVTDLMADPYPVAVNTPATLTAHIDDSQWGNLNIKDVYLTVDDTIQFSMNPCDGEFDSPTEDAFVDLEFAEAGVYEVKVYAEDGQYIGVSEPFLLVVYDPDGGFVTGGGWIWSPAGAYLPDPYLEGKANFGFVSKYKKGRSVPSGQTEFVFHAADFNFHSTEYEWLVVNQNDSRAQFKGTGTVNNEGYYHFMIWAADGDPDGDDTFRLRVWTEDNDGGETDIYDNGTDQVIEGGNIVVHTGK